MAKKDDGDKRKHLELIKGEKSGNNKGFEIDEDFDPDLDFDLDMDSYTDMDEDFPISRDAVYNLLDRKLPKPGEIILLNDIKVFTNFKEDPVVNAAIFVSNGIKISENDFFSNAGLGYGDDDDEEEEGDLYEKLSAAYGFIEEYLITKVEEFKVKGTWWQNYIINLLGESNNPCTRMWDKGLINKGLEGFAINDMEIIRQIYNIDWEEIMESLEEWGQCAPLLDVEISCVKTPNTRREALKKVFTLKTIKPALNALSAYYKANGSGEFEGFSGFVWNDGLVGVENQDPIRFKDLIGCDRQAKELIENTEFFLKGLPANNVLLYGDKGTGKSSSIKALLNKFSNEKLRMISISKEAMKDFNRIKEMVGNSGCKVILFIDDLSFEEVESDYRDFKSAMEGGLGVQPENLLIYATSNRRKLVKETWGDRDSEGNEISMKDGIEERTSLVDRFGLVISYLEPAQDEYFAMVEEMAKKEKLTLTEEDLKMAVRWELQSYGRSGRTARQFINYLKATKG